MPSLPSVSLEIVFIETISRGYHADMEPTPHPAAGPVLGTPSRIGFLLNQAHRYARAAANQAMQPYGLELRHFGVLAYAAQAGPRSQRQIVQALGLDKSSMVHIVDELERQGLAERRRGTTDRRAYEVCITAAGRARLQAAGDRAAAVMEALLSVLTPQEQTHLQGLLERFVEHASSWRAPPGEP